MESRPFRFRLAADAKLPTQEYVFWASCLWTLMEESDRKILLMPPLAQELPLCQALHARLAKAVKSWVGMQGRHEVAVIACGSYTLGKPREGLFTGNHVDCSPGTWLCRLIVINGQEPVVQGLRGIYLEGSPWEDSTALLGEVKGQVEVLVTAHRPDWARVAAWCERLIQAGFEKDVEVQQFLYSLWGQPGFRDPWSAVLQKHRRMPPGP